jgi:hypothetical protein
MRFDNIKAKIQDKEDLETWTLRDAELLLYQTMYLPAVWYSIMSIRVETTWGYTNSKGLWYMVPFT